MLKRNLTSAAVAAVLASMTAQVSAEELHIYNWSDYIAEDTIANFEAETGIKVTYDVYDSNEILETKLFAGRSGYDLVFPTARPFAGRHVAAGIYQPLNKALLSNLANADAIILKSLTDLDADNAHLMPYMWGTTGIGYNVEKVTAILGDDMPLDTWELVFNPEIVAKLSSCGVSLMDDATEVFAAVRGYKATDTADFSKAALESAADTIKAARPYIKYFHSSQYINDLANGDICVAHGYSGDILQARDRAAEADNGVVIEYAVPSEGAVVWTDVMAIPADSKNVAAAHKFIDYLLRPEIIAAVTNVVAYANANNKAAEFVEPSIANDAGIYPKQATREKFMVLTTPSEKQARDMNRLWTRIKTNQ